MASINLDIVSEYNAKAMESARAFADLGVANAQAFMDKQLALGNTLLEASLATQKEMASAKSPEDAVTSAQALVLTWNDALSGFAKDASQSAAKAGEELKAVVDSAMQLNTTYATKAYETGVAEVKKAAKKAA